MQYVELHSRSAFSFLEGASHPEGLALACAQQGMLAMALLDRNGLYGAARFHVAAKKIGIRAHIGAEVWVAETPTPNAPYFPLLARSRTGYQNLCRLITKTKLRAEKNTPTGATFDELQQHAEGLICLTGDEHGPLAQALDSGGKEAARRLLDRLQSIFGRNNLYVELQRHFNRRQEQRNQAAIELAHEFSLPLLATNGVCYATPPEREILDAFPCIRHKCQLDGAGRLLTHNSERHVRSAKEMTRLFADLPAAIANTFELSTRIDFSLEKLGYEFPRYPVPDGKSMNSFLRARTDEGARGRYGSMSDRVQQQLERELTLIERLDLAGYFLIVWDLIRFCREHNSLVQSPGSAAHQAVC